MKTTMTRGISNNQITALHAAFRKIGITDRNDRIEYINSQINRNVESTKELTLDEAKGLLAGLYASRRPEVALLQVEARNLVHEIYALSFKIPFLNKDYSELDSPEDIEMNKAKISAWTRKYAKCRKPISRMTVDELYAVKIQMRDIITGIKRKGGD